MRLPVVPNFLAQCCYRISLFHLRDAFTFYQSIYWRKAANIGQQCCGCLYQKGVS